MVEHSVHTRSVICSSQIAATRPVGQQVKTPPFHGGNMGSIPVRVTKKSRHLYDVWIFSRPVHGTNPSGSTTSILPSPDGRDAKHRSFWCSQKKMRSGTEAAAPPEYRPAIPCVSMAAVYIPLVLTCGQNNWRGDTEPAQLAEYSRTGHPEFLPFSQ